ncbi:MAG: arsenate reductase ArsC [Chloroflexota bacterium]|nr:arsenate reductase ArsC [Chloroflexota bacterium]
MVKNVLFVCVHNSGRSQMAEALFNSYSQGRFHAYSAGTQPASHINPVAMQAMAEIGLDISSNLPKLLTPELADKADTIITMGCGVEGVCPVVSVPTEDWQLADPSGKPIEEVREIREEISMRVKKLIDELSKKGDA